MYSPTRLNHSAAGTAALIALSLSAIPGGQTQAVQKPIEMDKFSPNFEANFGFQSSHTLSKFGKTYASRLPVPGFVFDNHLKSSLSSFDSNQPIELIEQALKQINDLSFLSVDPIQDAKIDEYFAQNNMRTSKKILFKRTP